MSFAEVVRSGLEGLVPAYPPKKREVKWSVPKPRKLGWKALNAEQLRDLARGEHELPEWLANGKRSLSIPESKLAGIKERIWNSRNQECVPTFSLPDLCRELTTQETRTYFSYKRPFRARRGSLRGRNIEA
jgi:hypothetical protein